MTMTEPNRVVVKTSIKKKLLGPLKKAFGNRKANQDVGKLAAFANGPASTAVATVVPEVSEADLPPVVQKARADIRKALEGDTGYLAMARRNLAQGRALLDTIVALKKIDFIRETDTGRRALALEGKLTRALGDYVTAEAAAASLVTKVALMQTEADCQPYYDFIGTSLKVSGDFQKLMADVRYAFENLIEFESIKAWVKGNPDEDSKVLERRLWLADQGINGVGVAADVLGKVPEPDAQAAAEGLKVCLRLVKIAKAYGDRFLRSRDANRQIEGYEQVHVKGAVLDAHTEDPTLMAQLLFKKHRANLEIALVMADQAVDTVGDLVPLVSTGWKHTRGRIVDVYEAYEEERIKLVRSTLVQLKEEDPNALGMPSTLEKVAKVGEATFGLFKDNVFDILAPLDALLEAGMEKISRKVLAIIFDKFPPDPAQAIDGGALQGMVDKIQDSFLKSFQQLPQLRNATPAGPRAVKANTDRPAKDRDENPVQNFLGGVATDAGGRRYRFATVGGRRGALYLDTREFTVDGPQLNPVVAQLLTLVPAKDSRGRPIAEVDLSAGFVTQATVQEPGVKLSDAGIRVRVGSLWGYIDQGTKVFYPVDVESSAYADWSTRTVTDDGYRENGTVVKGAWYRPWRSRPNEYVFVGPNGSEWASALQSTARGPGPAFNIGSCLERVKLASIELTAL